MEDNLVKSRGRRSLKAVAVTFHDSTNSVQYHPYFRSPESGARSLKRRSVPYRPLLSSLKPRIAGTEAVQVDLVLLKRHRDCQSMDEIIRRSILAVVNASTIPHSLSIFNCHRFWA